ncbi:MAG TPA: PDZ domain-containing protein [Pyrinomonadaceae bacterium]|nr:PDZ domain-containing protein [Pyrinomonadaceae bacterium]
MQPQQDFSVNSPGGQFCAQCGSPMPKEMRFCRSCGHRLGEGPAEYTETVRFPHTTAPAGGSTTPFYPGVNAPLVRPDEKSCKRRLLGFTGMTWIWIALALFFVTGGVMSSLRKNVRIGRPGISIPADTRSYVGVDDFFTTDGGVSFKNVEPPGGPFDKAGLVGGDIVTSFDGQPVREANEIMDLLGRTPTGRLVEVIYLRDGVSHTTKLTTIARDEYNRLEREFSNRPEGRGMFGFESNRMTRIINPETRTYGVRIDFVEPNGPADLFGVKEGDIITEFDHVPIRTPDEFLSRVRRAIPRVPVEVGVIRDDKRLVIPVTIGRSR